MKYGEEWANRCKELSDELAAQAINYKTYKKITKTEQTAETILAKLENDIHKVIMFMNSIQNNRQKRALSLLCECSRQSTTFPVNEIASFMVLNERTCYKLCKRLDKRLQTNIFSSWLRNKRNDKTIPFLSRSEITYLQTLLKCFPEHECPICLEPVQTDFLITSCGHILCTPCTLQMLQVSHLKGKLFNKIAYGLYDKKTRVNCPVCRDNKAFSSYKHVKNIIDYT